MISAANKKKKPISCQLYNSRRCVCFCFCFFLYYYWDRTIRYYDFKARGSKKHLVQLRHALDFHSLFSGLLGIFPNTSTGNHFVRLLWCEQLCQSSLFLFFHPVSEIWAGIQRAWNGNTSLVEKFHALNCTATRDELNVFTTPNQVFPTAEFLLDPT